MTCWHLQRIEVFHPALNHIETIMNISELQALLVENSGKALLDSLALRVSNPEDWQLTAGRTNAEIKGDDNWLVLAVHRTFGLYIGSDGMVRNSGHVLVIEPHNGDGATTSYGNASLRIFQGNTYWLWELPE